MSAIGGCETDSLLPNLATLDSQDRRRATSTTGRKTTAWTLVIVASVALAITFAVTNHGSGDFTPTSRLSSDVPLLGASRESSHSHHTTSHKMTCANGDYSKRTLKLAYELPFASLFQNTKGQRKYEASDIVVVDDFAYAVCDSSWAISRFDTKLAPFAENNEQIGDPAREKADSGYEALFHDAGTFYVVRESVSHDSMEKVDSHLSGYHAVIEELAMENDDYSVVEQCSTEFEFAGSSKGFEGALVVHDVKGEMVVLGLCEGNHCSQKDKNDSGHGVIIAMKKGTDKGGHCQWKTVRKIKIPKSANFRDYSAISLRPDTGKVAIASQEEAQMWVGSLLGRNDEGLWDIDNMEFDSKKGSVFDFPKNDNCETIYCNIEGVHWLNDDMVIAVSDKMKGKGKQDFVCFDKDQSVHVFVLP